MNSTVNVPVLFADIVAKVDAYFAARVANPFNVFFDFGRYLEIENRLVQKGKSTNQDTKRYPLVWLVIPYTEHFPLMGGVELTRMQIIIATQTRMDSSTPERFAANFEPFLWPIYDKLMEEIQLSGYFTDYGQNVAHDRVDQPYWDGKDAGTGQYNMFQDYIDAVQVKNISLTVNETTCEQFRLIGA